MSLVLPALALVVLGVAVVVLGSTLSLAAPANTGPVAALVYPVIEDLAIGTTVSIGSIQICSGTVRLATGWKT